MTQIKELWMSTSSWKAYSDEQLQAFGGVFKVLDKLGIKAAHLQFIRVNLNMAVREMNTNVQRNMQNQFQSRQE